MKRILAAVTAAVLGLGIGASAVALPAFATSLPTDSTAVGSDAGAPGANAESFWQTLAGEQCTKYEPVSSPYTLAAPPAGYAYSKLIVKSGNMAGGSVDHENYVWYPPNIIVGAQYQHQEKDSISHLILCVIPVDQPVEITVAPSAIDPTCDEDGSLVVPVTEHVTWSGGNNGDGPGNYTLIATADSGYYISGQSSFPVTVLEQLDGEECDDDQPVVITVLPSATDPSCENDGSLVVPVTEHVTWSGGNNGDGPGNYTLIATPDAGYYISGQSSFPVTVLEQLDAEECVSDAQVSGDPEPTDALCANRETDTPQQDGFYTIAEAEGVGYRVYVDDVLTSTITSTSPYGTVQFDVMTYPSTVKIVAFALPGYALNPDAEDTWQHTFLFDEELCNLQDFALVTPETDQRPASCTLSGQFFLGGDGVDWFTSPGGIPVAAGWHDVPSATTLTFEAVPGLGNAWQEQDQQTIFVFEFEDEPLDCLDTLAFTGNEGVPLFLGGAAALLLLGAASIFFTRKRTI